MQDQTNLITITENAANKFSQLIQEEPDAVALRIFVQGGGCSGLQYGFSWDNSINEDDFVIEKTDIKFAVDAMSIQYLQGAIIDFKEDFEGSNFVIENPNAQSTCGCGSSFNV